MNASQLRPKAKQLYKKLEEFMKEEVFPNEKEVLVERFGEDRWQPHPKLEELKVTTMKFIVMWLQYKQS